jgi:RHS repeat-associated protein
VTAPTASGAEAECPENRVKALDVLSWPRVGVRSPESPDRHWERWPRYDGKAVGTALARYYDPSTAQFLSVDPDVATTLSPYGYVQGNPLNGTDPSGDCGLWGSNTCWGDAAGAIVTAAKATGSAPNAALPAIHTAASLVAGAASICAIATSWTGVGGATCGAIALGAAAVTAGTGDILYAEGRESEGQAILDTVGVGLTGLGSAAEAGATALRGASDTADWISGLNDIAASNAPWYSKLGPWASSQLWSMGSSLYGMGASGLAGISYSLSAGAFGVGVAGFFGGC